MVTDSLLILSCEVMHLILFDLYFRDLPLYLQTWHGDPMSFDLSSLNRKMEEFVQNSFVTA